MSYQQYAEKNCPLLQDAAGNFLEVAQLYGSAGLEWAKRGTGAEFTRLVAITI
jgi:hypothetical protein